MKDGQITLKRALAAVLLLAVLAYGGAIVWLIANETRLVFRAVTELGDRRPSQPYELVNIPTARALLLPASGAADAKPWVIYLHGNDANIATRLNILHCEQLRALGLNVIAPEYRGFGGLSGVPTEAGLAEDAQQWYDYVRKQKQVEPRRIVIYGWSLGSAVAVTLASHVEEAAVILEGAPASIVAIGQQQYPFFPIRMVIRNPFESILRVGGIRAPMLFLHSPEDVVVPIAEGRRLFEAAAQPKQFVEVSGGHVYASEKDPAFFPAVRAFLQTQRLLP